MFGMGPPDCRRERPIGESFAPVHECCRITNVVEYCPGLTLQGEGDAFIRIVRQFTVQFQTLEIQTTYLLCWAGLITQMMESGGDRKLPEPMIGESFLFLFSLLSLNGRL